MFRIEAAMRATFRQLEVFVEAAVDGNFRKTADRLGISQPSVSNQILALEDRVGCTLFTRSRGSTPKLSAEGQAFLRKAQGLINQRRELIQPRPAAAKPRPLRLRIAAGPYLLDDLIHPALPRFLEQHEHIELEFLRTAPVRQFRSMLQNGDADVVAYTGPRHARKISGAEVICEIPCSLFGSARLARMAGRDLASVGALPFILPMEGTEIERWTMRTLAKAGIEPTNVVGRSQFPDVIAGLIVTGRGISMLFDEQMAEPLQTGRAFRLGPALENCSRVLLTGRRARTAAAAPLLDFLRRVLRARQT